MRTLKQKSIYILLVICLFSYGCDFLLTQEDVRRSIYTIMRGYETSTKNVQPQFAERYSNGGDLKFISRNETLVNEMRILVKDDKRMTMSGTCYFSGYEDQYSGYEVNGELDFDCEKFEKDDAVCEFFCNTTLTGGKVKKLEFSLEMDSDGACSVASVIANGKKIEFDQWAFVTQIVRKFTSNLTSGGV